MSIIKITLYPSRQVIDVRLKDLRQQFPNAIIKPDKNVRDNEGCVLKRVGEYVLLSPTNYKLWNEKYT